MCFRSTSWSLVGIIFANSSFFFDAAALEDAEEHRRILLHVEDHW